MTSGPAAVSLEQARTAVMLLGQVDDPPTELLSSALKVTAYHELRAGNGLSLAALEHAVELDAAARPVPVMERAGMVLGMLLRFACRFTMRVTTSTRCAAARRTKETTASSTTSSATGAVGLLGRRLRRCDRERARRAPVDGRDRHGITIGHLRTLARRSPSRQSRGGPGDGARRPRRGRGAGRAGRGRLPTAQSLGFIELSAGNLAWPPSTSQRALGLADRLGGEPAVLRVHGDAIEALIGLGRHGRGRAAHRRTRSIDRERAALVEGGDEPMPWADRCGRTTTWTQP